MRLIEGRRRRLYQVIEIKREDEVFRRLETIGLIKGAVLEILHQNWNGSMVLSIRNSRFGMGSSLLESIEVLEVSQ